MKDFPRRNQLDKCVSAELAIDKAITEVEYLGADLKLTDAIMKLQEARELVSDYVDETNPKPISKEEKDAYNKAISDVVTIIENHEEEVFVGVIDDIEALKK